MATHSSILAWEIPWTEESGGCKESDTTQQLNNNNHTVQIVEAGWWLHKGYNIISTFMYVKSILLAYFFALRELSFEGDLYTYKF